MKKTGPGQIRIVAGDWRGRKIPVLNAAGLRPTGDRVKETLFNWLALQVPGRRCLDLFAGTGALGFEAASRGASVVDLVEASRASAAQLQSTCELLNAGPRVTVHQSTAADFLAKSKQQYDIVFVDPPFEKQLHEKTVATVVDSHLRQDGFVYVEMPTSQTELLNKFPDSLSVYRDKRFGDVTVFLLQHLLPAP